MTFLLRVRRVVPPTMSAALGVLLALAIQAFDARASAQQDYGDPAPLEQDPALVDYSDEIPAHVSAVDGTATLEREGRIDPVEENIILLAGDRLRTTRGRLEILFADGSALAIDDHTSIDLLDDSLMRLLGGRVKLVIARATGGVEYRVDTAAGSALVRTPGEYRIALVERQSRPEVDLTVLRGTAELLNDHGRTVVRAGTYAVANALQAPSLPYVANSAAWTEFERWADDQRAVRTGAYSTRYLPTEVHYYAGAFDRYGDWNYEPTYGYVWYPRVATGWRPYHHGKWSFHGRFGWFWIGGGRWAWPTHHYGRWGIHSGRWFWIPGRQWGPAWVHWARSPRFVGWCPLGFDNRPVFSITNINVNINTHRPWHGWTVLPRQHFVPNVAVPRHGLAGSALPVSTWNDFRSAAPPRPNLRDDPAPIRSVGSRRGVAVPRNGAAPRAGFDGQAIRGSAPAIDAGSRSGSRAIPRDGAGARNGASSVQAPASQAPSGSRAPAGSRLATPSTPSSRSRAVPSDRTTAPIDPRSPVRLRSAPAPGAGSPAQRSIPPVVNSSPSRLTPRARPSDQQPASPPPTAIRRGQPAPGSSRQTPPPNVSAPDNGRVVPMPSGSRRTPDAVRVPPRGGASGGSGPSRSAPPRVAPGGASGGSTPSRSASPRVAPRGNSGGSAPSRSSSPRVAPGGNSRGSAPSRSAPSRVAPRGGQSSAPARSSSPPSRVSGGQGSRQAPPASSNRGQATRRGGGI